MVVDTAYYEALELKPEATLEEIKKSYKKLAMKYHPDKNPSPDAESKFKVIGEAYETLSDPELRKKYDMMGKEGANAGRGGVNPMDIFAQMFGGGGIPGFGGMPGGGNFSFSVNGMPFNMGNQQQGSRRTDDLNHTLNAPLELFYNSAIRTLKINRNIICVECHGQGGSDIISCSDCGGRGMKISVIRDERNPNFVQQRQFPCNVCAGSGKNIQNVCKICEGRKLVSSPKVVEIEIKKGCPDGHRIVFPNLSNEEVDCETGDIVFILQQKPHPVFTRIGWDLEMKRTITLKEALTGFEFNYTHLDGREVSVVSNDVISPGQRVKRVGEGMPKENSIEFGDLFIQYEIKFPEHITPENIEKLKEIL